MGWSDLWAARASIQFIIFIYLCIYFGPVFSHGTGVGITCMLLPLSLGPLHWQLCFFSLQTQPDVTRPCTQSVVFVAWLQPQKCKGVCKMENKKEQGWSRKKLELKKRKVLERDAAKCAKIDQ